MSIIIPEIEIVDRANRSIRYLEHGWPEELCRWHAHVEYELHLIVETRGKAFVGDYIGDFQPGSLYLTGPNLPHNWITDKSVTHEVVLRDMLIQFDHTNLQTLMSAFPEFREINPLLEMAQSGIEFIDFDTDEAKQRLAEIRDSRGSAQILKFMELLHVLNSHGHKKALSVLKVTQPESNKKMLKIGEVIDYIIKNYADDFSLGQAAKMAGMSEASFARNFQSATGNRFTEFVNRVRIGQACALLYETDEKISSVCYDVGFQNLANFNRHFLRMKDMTPSEYRSAARAGLSKEDKFGIRIIQ